MDAAPNSPSQLNDFADSFINFDYVPEVPAPDNANDTTHAASALGLPDNSKIEDNIEKITLTENEGNIETRTGIIANDDVAVETERFQSDSSSTTSSSTTSSSAREIEEGEIVDSDAYVDYHPSEEGSEDETSSAVRSNNEREEILPTVPPVNATLGPHHQMMPVGIVTSIVGDKVIVEGGENHEPLNEGSILWMTQRGAPFSAMPLRPSGHWSPISGIGQGFVGATNVNSSFPPANTGPDLSTSGHWTNGPTHQQFAVRPGIGFPAQPMYQSHGFPPAIGYPGLRSDMYAQPMYGHGPMNQNSTYGLRASIPQVQPSRSFNQHAPYEFNLGASSGRRRWNGDSSGRGRWAGRGRRTFYHGGRKGWRPPR